MLLEQGWLVGARRVPSPHYDCRPDDETPTLLVVHNISLPPGEFGGPWIDALFTGTIDPQAHPFFAEIAHLRVSAHCLINVHGMRESLSIRGANAAMIFLLGLSLKAPIRWRIPMRSINSLRRLRGH